ncbi:interferon-induced very large GTPase 1-like [Mytilus edulis]|uniref:interferon-induced very large GTPase 1-like n=1 Tax=Mytilus edulis TaxID=6550 RepID=UPI0039EDEA5B
MKAAADRITGCIRKMSSKTKADLLPLQGEPWKKWSEKLKYVKKTSKFKSLQEQSLIEIEMNEARKVQLQMCKDLGAFMKILIETIVENLQFDTELTVLFACLKIYFDEQSRNILPEYLARYESKWHELKSAHKDKDSATKINELKRELRDHEYELAEASFGFEHLCREMGQMYEAIIECKIKDTAELESYRKVLPQIGVKLLLLGFSLELMDGDTATVPFHWIQAVLNELTKSVNDTKILVLSVLGLQSSGKSTLLNTMFGLQFAVSAGRCTRGVYMQLVPVLDERKPYKYVLVLDTEGLRAPELGREKYRHDNELATFVVGLGDVTIVNVKGENTSEVHDILQIVVHAFLRIKLANDRLNLQQKCVFVHQNVSATDAKTNLIQQRQKFVETLDNMTIEAAGEENIRDIKTFSEVIEFNIDKDVYYFPDLWYGDPPMAPANPGYSKCVQKVKHELLLPSLVTGRQTYLTITDTISRISDLWVGILKDDFVFGFRNSLEVKAYNSMEKQCQQLKWSLEKYVFELTTSEAKIILMKCENDYDLEKSFSNIVDDFTVQIAEKMKGLCKKLDAFVDKSSLKDVMIQWTDTQKHTFKMLAQNLVQKANSDICITKEEIKIQRLKERGKMNHEREINKLATKLAVKMQGQNPSRDELEEKFDHVWKSWINNLNLKDDIEVDSIDNQIKKLLRKKFLSFTAFFGDEQIMADPLPCLERSIAVDSIVEEHYRRFNYIKILFWKESNVRCKIVDVINETFKKIDRRLLEIESQDIRFNIVYVTEIMNAQ